MGNTVCTARTDERKEVGVREVENKRKTERESDKSDGGLIYQILSVACRKRTDGEGGEGGEEDTSRGPMKRAASEKKTSALAEGRKL